MRRRNTLPGYFVQLKCWGLDLRNIMYANLIFNPCHPRSSIKRRVKNLISIKTTQCTQTWEQTKEVADDKLIFRRTQPQKSFSIFIKWPPECEQFQQQNPIKKRIKQILHSCQFQFRAPSSLFFSTWLQFLLNSSTLDYGVIDHSDRHLRAQGI